MRFLFVYEHYAAEARNLIQQLVVSDVILIVVRKGELHPNDEELELLRQHEGADAAACEVNRKYRKNVDRYVKFSLVPKKFRINDQQLYEWLRPQPETDDAVARPADAFREASTRAPRLLLHPGALTRADELDENRWSFAARAAELLECVARGEILGPFRDWEGRHGVAFAANGQVRYEYEIITAGDSRRGVTEWHLKAGDKTTPERAARIYFATAELGRAGDMDAGVDRYVFVLYVGPHPAAGVYTVRFDAI
jgi:hypothetical protein